jgi:hypothetical protein
MNPELVNFHLPTTDQFSVAVDKHPRKASSIRLDAIGVVLAPGQEPSVTHVRAVG